MSVYIADNKPVNLKNFKVKNVQMNLNYLGDLNITSNQHAKHLKLSDEIDVKVSDFENYLKQVDNVINLD